MTRPSLWLLGAACISAFAPADVAAQQQNSTITGHARAEAGNSLPGATVAIPEFGLGTIVRENGDYLLTIPAARVRGQAVTMSVRIIGYKERTAQVTLRAG